jgi:hypothetical protein
MDFTQATNLRRANNLSMLPDNKFTTDNLKKEITREDREEEQPKIQLVNIEPQKRYNPHPHMTTWIQQKSSKLHQFN